jgi:hypothetical protein
VSSPATGMLTAAINRILSPKQRWVVLVAAVLGAGFALWVAGRSLEQLINKNYGMKVQTSSGSSFELAPPGPPTPPAPPPSSSAPVLVSR